MEYNKNICFSFKNCIDYAHAPKAIGRKLDDRREKCIFVGYSEKSKSYKLYNVVTKKTVVTRDVKFLKDEAWN